jgi:hypothetical protein
MMRKFTGNIKFLMLGSLPTKFVIQLLLAKKTIVTVGTRQKIRRAPNAFFLKFEIRIWECW